MSQSALLFPLRIFWVRDPAQKYINYSTDILALVGLDHVKRNQRRMDEDSRHEKKKVRLVLTLYPSSSPLLFLSLFLLSVCGGVCVFCNALVCSLERNV